VGLNRKSNLEDTRLKRGLPSVLVAAVHAEGIGVKLISHSDELIRLVNSAGSEERQVGSTTRRLAVPSAGLG
jgi:hypothetical protein